MEKVVYYKKYRTAAHLDDFFDDDDGGFLELDTNFLYLAVSVPILSSTRADNLIVIKYICKYTHTGGKPSCLLEILNHTLIY